MGRGDREGRHSEAGLSPPLAGRPRSDYVRADRTQETAHDRCPHLPRRPRRARPAAACQNHLPRPRRRRRRRAVSRISPGRSAGVRQRPAEAGDLRHLAGFRPARGQGRGGRLCACLRRVGGGDRARRRRGARGQGRLFRPLCRAAGAHQCEALRRGQPARRAGLRSQGAASANHRRLCPRQGSARAPGHGEPRRDLAGGRDLARRRRDLSRRAAAGAGQRLGRGRRRRPPGNRQRRLWRPRGLRALHRHQCLAGRGRQRHPPGAGQSRSGAGAGRRNGRRARAGLARRHAARSGRSRARRRLQPQEDLGLCRPDGTAGRGQGRHRGRRRHHGAAPRLAVDRRRRHADQPHRADRGRHPGRLYAGPAERPADGHEADRQRPARKLRAMCRCRA